MHMDTGFRPSTHGFGFPNTWNDLLLGVVASRGRCGGMVFAALDRFAAGVPLAPTERARVLPDRRSPLAHHIWRRQVESIVTRLGSNLWRFARLTYLPSHAPGGTASTTQRELPGVLAALEAGRPVPLGLVSGLSVRHLARNHQVLAYAADVGDGLARVRIYDPNFPHRDDVVLEVHVADADHVVERVGARIIPWRGFFPEHYTPSPVAGARVSTSTPAPERAADKRIVAGTAVVLGSAALAWLVSRRRRH